MENILVTGGCGYIGSHVTLSLLEKGYDVTVLDSNINSSRSILKKIQILSCANKKTKIGKLSFSKVDIRNKFSLEKVFSENARKGKEFNAVIHLAGLKSVKESINYPEAYWDNNVNGSINLLNTMHKHNCFKLVFSSSATVYGHPKKYPILENFETHPINPYGRTKLKVENIIKEKFLQNPNQFRFIILRYFNPIGAHYSGIIGEQWRYCSDNLFPNILKVALRRKKFLKVYGRNWPTIDGTTIRDYIHIMDLADGHVAALDYMKEKKSHYLILNLGTGRETTILELIKKFESTNKIDIPLRFIDPRKGDTPILLADSKLASKILNWKSTKNLSDMCRDGWKFAQQCSRGF